jgi:transposase
VRLHKELSQVERPFADLKNILDVRPIYHRTDNRMQAHIYAALAFQIYGANEKKLKAARLDLSATRPFDGAQIRPCRR